MTGKTTAQRQPNEPTSPFPVNKVILYGCDVLRGLEGILRVVSLYLYNNNIIDRKWMNVLIFTTNLLQYLCKSLSGDDKLGIKKK